jgi:AcrR family transcriptional regulator
MAASRPPRRASRPSNPDARERILTAATELFYERGINATGVERLAEVASVSKRTLYKHFPTKSAVVEGYLRELADDLDPRSTPESSPRDRLLAIFNVESAGRVRGCPFHNAAVEAADEMPGVQALVTDFKRRSIDALEEMASVAGARQPDRLARQLAVLFEGAMALATSLNDPQPIDDAREAAAELISIALGPPRRTRMK